MLKKEQCPDNLANIKRPSITDDKTKPQSMIYDKDDQKKSTELPDGIQEEINGKLAPNHGSTFSAKHPWDNKPSDKKNHYVHPSDRDRSKKKDHPDHPDGKNKPDKYDSYPFNLFSPSKPEDLDYLDGPQLSSQSPKGHRSKKPYQITERFDNHSNPSPDKSNDSDKPEQLETDGLDYPNGSRPPQFISQPPHFTAANHSGKYPKKLRLTKEDRSNSRPNKSELYGSDKQPDESSPYDSNEDSFLTPNGFGGVPNSSKRPGRSPYGSSHEHDSKDVSASWEPDEFSKRVPRRGDIQSLDEDGKISGR